MLGTILLIALAVPYIPYEPIPFAAELNGWHDNKKQRLGKNNAKKLL
jgi:hypothetical protein